MKKHQRNIQTEGVILASRRAGDLHRSLTVISSDLGVLQVMAYGARKGGSKLTGWVEPYASGLFHIYHNPVRQQYKITDVQQPVFREHIREEMYATYLAAFLSEIIIRTYGGGGEYEPLSRFAVETLDVLDGQAAAGRVREPDLLVQTIWRFLKIIGYVPDLLHCGECGRDLDTTEELYMDRTNGYIRCGYCRNSDEGRLPQGIRRYLLHTLSLPVSTALAVTLEAETMGLLRRLSLDVISDVVNVPLKTLRGGIL